MYEIHSLINATFVPRPVRCTYHVARSELCLLHKPHQINIPSGPRSSNGLILAILPNGKHAPRPLRARFRSTVPSLARPALRDPGGLHALASPSRADRRCSDRARARRRRRSLGTPPGADLRLSTGRARPRQAGGVPASVVRSSPHHGQSLSRMQPGAHRPFERPLRPEQRGG